KIFSNLAFLLFTPCAFGRKIRTYEPSISKKVIQLRQGQFLWRAACLVQRTRHPELVENFFLLYNAWQQSMKTRNNY
ncbi:MAG: hypothetical protein ACYTEE_10265, partial [Planctomycetota bacterium]